MKTLTLTTRHLLLAGMIAVMAGLLSGCGTDRSPVAYGDDPTTVAAESGQDLAPAAKIADFGDLLTKLRNADWAAIADRVESASRTKKIRRTGGILTVIEKLDFQGSGMLASLVVPRGALTETKTITMSVIGDDLSSLVVGFQPAGLVFNKPASLRILLGRDRVDLSVEEIRNLIGLHLYANGNVEQVDVRSMRLRREGVWLVIEVPGFSRYALGGGA